MAAGTRKGAAFHVVNRIVYKEALKGCHALTVFFPEQRIERKHYAGIL